MKHKWTNNLGLKIVSLLVSCLICCITIIGIPVGLQAFKFSVLSIAPFGAKIRKA